MTSSTKIETMVLKLSGRLFFSEQFEPVSKAITRAIEARHNLRLAVIAGGGSTAREYISVAEKLGADQASMDEIGISVSRVNAMVLTSALGEISSGQVPKTLEETVNLLELGFPKHRVVVMGGLHPGQSTNAVGALVSEKLRANMFVNATDVDGVYSKDPKKYPGARKLSKVTVSELSKLLDSESMRAGGYDLMDPVALKLIQRSKIRTRIILCDADEIEKELLGRKEIHGTEIIFNK
jgi:uridylate kinase